MHNTGRPPQRDSSMHPVFNIDERTVQKFCESHRIHRLALLGSQAKGTAQPESVCNMHAEDRIRLL